MVRYSQQQEFMLTIFALRYNFRHDQNEGFIWSFAMGSLDELNYRTVCRKLNSCVWNINFFFFWGGGGWNCWIIEYSSLKWQSKQSHNFKIGAPSVLSRKLFCISIIIRIDYSIQQRLFTYLHTYQLFNVQNPHGQVRHLPAFCINLFGFIVLLHSVLLLVPSFLGFSDFISAWITSRSLLRGQSLGFLSSVQCMIDFLGHASSSICIKCP